MNGQVYLSDAIKRFRETRTACDRALAQVPFERWGRRLDPEANSIVTLMLHLSGNMLSRWSDFLGTDGEKPGRDRDSEFEDPRSLTQDALLERWSRGWDCLLGALSSLTEGDLDRTVTIRSQPLTVVEAINRQLAHVPYHAGQLIFLCKHLAEGPWQSLSIPRHGSAAFNQAMTKRE